MMKNMKKMLLTIASVLLLAGMFPLSAQDMDPECMKYLSYYKEYYKQKSYEQAIPSWRKAFEICPKNTRETVYTEGATLYRTLISKNRNNAILKEELIDTLLMLHDLRAEYYPKSAAKAVNAKAIDMTNYIKDDNKRLYEGCKAAIAENGTKTIASVFVFEMQAAIDLYQNGLIDAETIIDDYEAAVNTLDGIIAAGSSEYNKDVEKVTKVKTDVENLFIASKVASCESLIALFEPRLAADPDNLDLATKVAKMMAMTEDCTDNNLFLAAVNTMNRLNPSYSSAYMLYKLYSSKGEVEMATKCIEEAIAYEESDTALDAQYYYELATFSIKHGKTVKAVEAALKAAELNPDLAGNCYMICGNAWQGQRCGGDEITSRANYWVAVDYYNKAKAADPSLAEEVNPLISRCSVYYPNTADAFMYGYTNGQGITVSCGGLRASTTVRTQK